jgi:hypothetical protein
VSGAAGLGDGLPDAEGQTIDRIKVARDPQPKRWLSVDGQIALIASRLPILAQRRLAAARRFSGVM